VGKNEKWGNVSGNNRKNIFKFFASKMEFPFKIPKDLQANAKSLT